MELGFLTFILGPLIGYAAYWGSVVRPGAWPLNGYLGHPDHGSMMFKAWFTFLILMPTLAIGIFAMPDDIRMLLILIALAYLAGHIQFLRIPKSRWDAWVLGRGGKAVKSP